MTDRKLFRRLSLLLLCTPLVLLAGCPADDPLVGTAGAPAKTSSKTTAPTLTPQAQAAAATAAQVATQAAAQSKANDAAQNAKMQQLITTAEASYNSGVKNYQANRLDAARLDFDYAVDSMLSSGFDLQAEGPLADEFERLIDAINSLEMAALKQGNGFSPKIEEAPLDLATDTTFAPDPELVAKLKNELNITSDLPLVINDQVAGYIGVFSHSNSFRNHMAASLERAGKYRAMMQKILAEEGVPQDLIYLSVAESGFQPQALNARSGAGGMWQFMPYTGHDYGLMRNGFFDERFDPEKSTRAYARYIKYLYNQFGDWYLAMAAFNWGPGAMQRAVQRTGYADFWELYRHNAMPAETRAYVPEILAAVIMAKNPTQYGLDHVVPDAPVLYDTVTIDYAIDLRLAADVTGSTVQELAALNPSLLRLATPADMSFALHIPAGTKDLYTDRLKDIPEDRRASWRFHVVKPGETVASIALALHARATDIAETNGITAADPMAVDDELVIPIQTVASAAAPQRYTVRRGDTLVTIADRFNISLDELRRWNRLTASAVKPGRSLFVQEPVRLAPSMRGQGRSAGRGRGRHGRATRSRVASGSRRGRSSSRATDSSQARNHVGKHGKAAPTRRKPAPAKRRRSR
jgi:membrane-bound lytic murein transglycosylase D